MIPSRGTMHQRVAPHVEQPVVKYLRAGTESCLGGEDSGC